MSREKQPIFNKLDFKVKEIKSSTGVLLYSFEGLNINSAIVNTLKRVVTSDIPCYGFHRHGISITDNNTIYNNYMIINRVEMIPVFNEEHDVEIFDKARFFQNHKTLSEKYDVTLFKEDGKEIFIEKEKKESAKAYDKQIELRVSYENKTDENVDITTHNCEIVVVNNNEKTIKDYKNKPPIIITIVKPGQKFSMTATAELGIGKYGSNWSSVVIERYAKINNNSYEFGFSTIGSLSNRSIIYKACNIIIHKLTAIGSYISEKYGKEVKTGTIDLILHHENHTMGNLINYHLQEHQDVIYSGYAQPHLLIDEIIISYDTFDKNPLIAFNEVITYLKRVFTDIIRQL